MTPYVGLETHFFPQKRYSHSLAQPSPEVGTISVITITLRYIFALLHNVLYLQRIVNASDSYRCRIFAGVIASDSALSLQVSVIALLRYRYCLSNISKHYHFYGSNGVILMITLPEFFIDSSPILPRKKGNSIQKLHFLLPNIQKSLVIFALSCNALP